MSKNIELISGLITDQPNVFNENIELNTNTQHFILLDPKVELSDGMAYHLRTNRPLYDPIYRPTSIKYYEMIREARQLRDNNKIRFLSDHWLNEDDVGQFVKIDNSIVPLDLPIMEGWNLELNESGDKPLNKPMKNSGKGKKWVVYVKNPATGKVKKITFGDKKGGLKGNWNDPEARKNFASRHNCAEKNDKLTAGYWACRAHKYFGKNVPGRFW